MITGSDATVSSNLTYTGSQNGTIELGYPVALTEVKNVNGDVIWSTISTALLRIVNVTYGQSFTSTDNVSGVLQTGKSYTFDAWPQIHSQNGEFIGNQLLLSFELQYQAQLKPVAHILSRKNKQHTRLFLIRL